MEKSRSLTSLHSCSVLVIDKPGAMGVCYVAYAEFKARLRSPSLRGEEHAADLCAEDPGFYRNMRIPGSGAGDPSPDHASASCRGRLLSAFDMLPEVKMTPHPGGGSGRSKVKFRNH